MTSVLFVYLDDWDVATVFLPVPGVVEEFLFAVDGLSILSFKNSDNNNCHTDSFQQE